MVEKEISKTMPAKTYDEVNGQKLLKDLLERKDEIDFDGNKICIQINGKNYLRYDAVVRWINLAMCRENRNEN